MTHPHARAARAPSRRGMTLIELVVAVAIIAVLATAAVPVTTKMLTYKARKATREELQVLADAALDAFRDTGKVPSSVADLLVDTGDDGWSGPYLAGVVTDQVSGSSGYEVDAWSRAYDVSVSGDRLAIVSAGEDARKGSADDLEVLVDVTVARREHTVGELKLLNQSILAYNSLHQVDAPLSSSWPSAYATLVSQGFLPSHAGYLTDGWGQTYVALGSGGPLVELTSSALSRATGGSGNSGGGSTSNGNGKANGKTGAASGSGSASSTGASGASGGGTAGGSSSPTGAPAASGPGASGSSSNGPSPASSGLGNGNASGNGNANGGGNANSNAKGGKN